MQKSKFVNIMRMKNMSSSCATLNVLVVLMTLLNMMKSSESAISISFGECKAVVATDKAVFEFARNLDYLGSEFYFNGALGKGFDTLYPGLAFGGPPPIGAKLANLDPLVRGIFEQFGYQEVAHLKAIIEAADGRGMERPLLNLSKEAFAELFDKAFPSKLNPPFDPYAHTINFLLAANIFTYNGLVGLVGATPALLRLKSRKLAASFLGAEGGQNAIIRTLLYQRANETVKPYNITVAEFTNRTSMLANQLGKCGIKDEGLVVPWSLGAENKTGSNIIAADANSGSYSRTPQELLRILYGTGNERKPGAFFPNGANGYIARSFL